jgi:site-specific DNA-methyltransferase (adenine-specific)
MMGSQSSRIAAYKMGFDYVGCELDKEYFDKGCERFNRECLGEIKIKGGRIAKQLTLF